MLTCKQITELVTDYLEGRLPLGARLSFRMHISMCANCRTYISQLKQTVRTLGALPVEPIPSAVRDDLMAAFRNANPRRQAQAVARPATGRLWSIGAAMIAAMSVMVVFMDGQGGWEVGSLRAGLGCLLAVASPGALVLAVTFGVVRLRARPTPRSALVALAGLGAFAGQVRLCLQCPMAHVSGHIAAFHVGGVVTAMLLGALVARFALSRDLAR